MPTPLAAFPAFGALAVFAVVVALAFASALPFAGALPLAGALPFAAALPFAGALAFAAARPFAGAFLPAATRAVALPIGFFFVEGAFDFAFVFAFVFFVAMVSPASVRDIRRRVASHPAAEWLRSRAKTSTTEKPMLTIRLTIRRADERGHADHGWLDTRHTFSFADFHDPRHMGFRSLRVINEDRVQPGRGFGTHGHRDMEIVSYVLEGALQHKDSMGTGSVIRPGDVQRMSAGTGVLHSEFNASHSEVVHFLQIWLLPAKAGLAPGYEQKTFGEAEKRGRLRLIASPDGADGSVTVHSPAKLYASALAPGETVEHAVAAGRHAWVQVVRGSVRAGDEVLTAGDGASTSDAGPLAIEGGAGAGGEFLVFDLG
jgi:redox-sensitive bicupin YhaK (pirin superfamily)